MSKGEKFEAKGSATRRYRYLSDEPSYPKLRPAEQVTLKISHYQRANFHISLRIVREAFR